MSEEIHEAIRAIGMSTTIKEYNEKWDELDKLFEPVFLDFTEDYKAKITEAINLEEDKLEFIEDNPR